MHSPIDFLFVAAFLFIAVSVLGATFNGLALYFVLRAHRSPYARHLWRGAFFGVARTPEHLTSPQRVALLLQRWLVILGVAGSVLLLVAGLLSGFYPGGMALSIVHQHHAA